MGGVRGGVGVLHRPCVVLAVVESCMFFSFNDVKRNVSGTSLVGLTVVGAGVPPGDVRDDERAAEGMLHDLDGATRSEVDHATVVEPEDILRVLRGQLHVAV